MIEGRSAAHKKCIRCVFTPDVYPLDNCSKCLTPLVFCPPSTMLFRGGLRGFGRPQIARAPPHRAALTPAALGRLAQGLGWNSGPQAPTAGTGFSWNGVWLGGWLTCTSANVPWSLWGLSLLLRSSATAEHLAPSFCITVCRLHDKST